MYHHSPRRTPGQNRRRGKSSKRNISHEKKKKAGLYCPKIVGKVKPSSVAELQMMGSPAKALFNREETARTPREGGKTTS